MHIRGYKIIVMMILCHCLMAPCRSQYCGQRQDYIPDTNRLQDCPVRYVRINFQVIADEQGANNFDEVLGTDFLLNVLKIANFKLIVKSPMNLPINNNIPNIPCRYQYVLAPNQEDNSKVGIYFRKELKKEYQYFNSAHTTANNVFSSYWYNQYAINKGKELNIFFLSHHPDSVKSATYSAKDQGVGPATYVLMANAFQLYTYNISKGMSRADAIESASSLTANLLNHEIGHSLGLWHTWNSDDNCDDTPMNPGCWYSTDAQRPCSNNMMDYNAGQSAITPCQLSIIHSNFANKNSSQYQLLDPVWCSYDDTAKVIIYSGEHVIWQGSKDLNGDIIIRNNGILEVKCVVSLPKQARIVLYPKATLIVDGGVITNTCGEKWKGLSFIKKKKSTARVNFLHDGKLDNYIN